MDAYNEWKWFVRPPARSTSSTRFDLTHGDYPQGPTKTHLECAYSITLQRNVNSELSIKCYCEGNPHGYAKLVCSESFLVSGQAFFMNRARIEAVAQANSRKFDS